MIDGQLVGKATDPWIHAVLPSESKLTLRRGHLSSSGTSLQGSRGSWKKNINLSSGETELQRKALCLRSPMCPEIVLPIAFWQPKQHPFLARTGLEEERFAYDKMHHCPMNNSIYINKLQLLLHSYLGDESSVYFHVYSCTDLKDFCHGQGATYVSHFTVHLFISFLIPAAFLMESWRPAWYKYSVNFQPSDSNFLEAKRSLALNSGSGHGFAMASKMQL